MKLFLSGQKNVSYKELPPSALKLKRILEKSKDGELFLTQQVAVIVGVNPEQILRHVMRLPVYTCLVGSKRYWGKPSTIKQLVKESK